jgi:hypothetical protein
MRIIRNIQCESAPCELTDTVSSVWENFQFCQVAHIYYQIQSGFDRLDFSDTVATASDLTFDGIVESNAYEFPKRLAVSLDLVAEEDR